MAKYAMLDCWDDLNKGDLGIMLATVAEIKRQDPSAEIIGVSCYNREDPCFAESHKDLRKFVPDIYPAIFGIYGIKILNKYHQGIIAKTLAMIWESVRCFLIMLLPRKIGLIFLARNERETLKALISCDVCFSKGGSIFTDDNTLRGAIGLRRMCRTYDLLYKFNCPYCILGQSFGPIRSRAQIKHTNRVIARAVRVFIRETECRKLYPDITLDLENVKFSNDIAFLLEETEPKNLPFNRDIRNVGLTVRSFGNCDEYIECMKKVIAYIVESGACVHIFQQVAMDNEPDNQCAEAIVGSLTKDIRSGVVYHKEHFLPQELKWTYGNMDYFIGTRLHSTIFAMAAGTITIGMVYHGTKAQGVFDNLGLRELIVDNPVTFEKIKEKIEYIEKNREVLKSRLTIGTERAKEDARNAVCEIVKLAQNI